MGGGARAGTLVATVAAAGIVQLPTAAIVVAHPAPLRAAAETPTPA